jgi:hypothetical protein
MTNLKIFFIRLWLKFQLNRDKIIKVDERHRGIGKTTMLVKRAEKEGLAIVVGNQPSHSYIRNMSSKVAILRLAPNFTFEIKGNNGNYPNGVLIDDSVDAMMIAELHNNNFVIRGGFINSEFVVKK